MNWEVPLIWPGRTVAVLASGPSMSQEVADRVRHLPRITVNTTYRLAPDADIIYGCDASWWQVNPGALACPGLKVSMEVMQGVRQELPASVHVLRHTGREGFDPHPGCLRTHNNGGAQAVQVAAHAGAEQIILLGFDMHGGHWHEAQQIDPRQFERWIYRFRELARVLSWRGVDLVNCTEGSALDSVRRSSLDEVLAQREAA